jgi:hypothetical protein
MGTGSNFPGGKAAEVWSCLLTSIACRSQEYVDLYLHSSLRLHVKFLIKHRDKFTFTPYFTIFTRMLINLFLVVWLKEVLYLGHLNVLKLTYPFSCWVMTWTETQISPAWPCCAASLSGCVLSFIFLSHYQIRILLVGFSRTIRLHGVNQQFHNFFIL